MPRSKCTTRKKDPLARRTRSVPSQPKSDAVSISGLLAERGLDTPEAQATGRAILEAEGLTLPKKQNISVEKRQTAEALLDAGLYRACKDCRAQEGVLATSGKQVVTVTGAGCEVCGGRTVTRSLIAMEKALLDAGLGKVVIVGGSPAIYDELRRGIESPDIELILVEGSSTQNANRAAALAQAADVIVIWGSSILAHKTSASFQKVEYRKKTVLLNRRSIEALSQELVKHAAGR